MNSVEQAVIALCVEEGSLKKLYQAGVTAEYFEMYDEEFQWLEKQAQKHKPINPRRFREKFPEFDWVVPAEEIQDLVEDLKQERAYVTLRAAIETVDESLEPDNAVGKASELRDYLSEIIRAHAPVEDIDLGGNYKAHLERIRQLRVLRENGEVAGIPTGFKWIDHNWGGLIDGRVITVLGRSGEMKSFFQAAVIAAAWKAGYRIGLFSPEMNEHEHTCRMDTLLSADPLIQKECGITAAFRNRALMEGVGFPLKKYERFKEFQSSMRGRCILFTNKYRREKMTPSFIEAKIEDLRLDFVVVDPIYKLKSPKKRDSKVWEIADLIDEIEDIAKGHNIPIIISNQSHRQMGIKQLRRAPGKDSSYMSDAIIHESDHVIGVKYDPDDHLLYLNCSKSRFGGEFDISCNCHPNIGLIEETSQPQVDWRNGYHGERNGKNFKKKRTRRMPSMPSRHRTESE